MKQSQKPSMVGHGHTHGVPCSKSAHFDASPASHSPGSGSRGYRYINALALRLRFSQQSSPVALRSMW